MGFRKLAAMIMCQHARYSQLLDFINDSHSIPPPPTLMLVVIKFMILKDMFHHKKCVNHTALTMLRMGGHCVGYGLLTY